MDTMFWTKIVGGFGGALLVFLLGGWGAQVIYGAYPEEKAAAEGEEPRQAYTIPVPDAPGAAPEKSQEELVAEFQTAFAAADPAAGQAEFRPCSACHSLVQGDNRTGPYLYGIVGRPVDTAVGYEGYSGALEEVAQVWDPIQLNLFLENPRGYAPGTKMNFNGIRNVQDRANLIAYLATNPGG